MCSKHSLYVRMYTRLMLSINTVQCLRNFNHIFCTPCCFPVFLNAHKIMRTFVSILKKKIHIFCMLLQILNILWIESIQSHFKLIYFANKKMTKFFYHCLISCETFDILLKANRIKYIIFLLNSQHINRMRLNQ